MIFYFRLIILKKQVFQDNQLQNLESMAQLEKKRYVYETQYMTLGKLAYLFSVLRNQKVNRINASISCPDRDFIQQLSSTFNKKKPRIIENKRTPIIGRSQNSLESVRKGRYKRLIDLQNEMIAKVFINQYRNKLHQLGKQYNLSMVWEATFINVYSENPISTLFQSQIIDMKHKLKWIIETNEQFFKKLNVSRQIQNRLNQLKIKIAFLPRHSRVLLHSSEVSIQDIKQVVKKFSYDAIILKFDIEIYSRKVNRIYFRMLIYHCEPKLNQISEDYEIKHEININKLGIILHTQDPIFSQQPKQLLSKFLSKVVFITYYSCEPTKHIMHIRNNKPKSNCLQVMMSDIFVYTSWNTNKNIEPEEVAKAFQIFFLEMNENTILRVAIKTGGLNPNAIDRVQAIAMKYHLICQPPQFSQNLQEILHIKFKSFNHLQRSNKIAQICNFLIELITGKDSKEQYKLPTKLEAATVPQNTDLSESLSQQNSLQVGGQNSAQTVSQVIQQKVQVDGIQFDYTNPQFVISQRIGLKNGKRNKKLQQVLYDKFRLSTRVWNLVIQYNIYKPLKESKFAKCTLYPIELFEFQSQYKIKKPVILKFTNLRIDQTYYLISKTSNSEEFELAYKMIVYNA